MIKIENLEFNKVTLKLLDEKGYYILDFFKIEGLEDVSKNLQLTFSFIVEMFNATVKNEDAKLSLEMTFFEALPLIAPFIHQGFLGMSSESE